MGRSGSIALLRSLYAHGEFVLATHWLDPIKIREGGYHGSAIWACKHIVLKQKKARIISMIRNPVECMVSVFGLSRFREKRNGRFESRDGLDRMTPDELNDWFKTDYFEKQGHLHQLQWFDAEFKAALGIDVYNYPFDKEMGYVQFQEGTYDVLILRTEMDDARKSHLISDFLGTKDLKMVRENVGERSHYGDIYKMFRQQATVPEEYLDTIINSRYAQHFFTQETLDAMKQRFKA